MSGKPAPAKLEDRLTTQQLVAWSHPGLLAVEALHDRFRVRRSRHTEVLTIATGWE